MPKRVCPFEEDLLPQIKVHVGEKHVVNGSNERMKDVYDKTLNLLKAGTKKLLHNLNKSAQLDTIDLLSSGLLSYKFTSNQKQLLLTNKLQLKASDKVINDIKVDLCGCSQLIDQSTVNKCYYCDQVLCSSCLSACANCSELFCQTCSVPIYNNKEEIMCFNCYR